jgi:putative phage-type endonuclease
MAATDSDYSPDEDTMSSDDETQTFTETDDESVEFGEVDEPDVLDVIETAMELIDNYYMSNLLFAYSSKFHSEIITYATEIIMADMDSMVGEERDDLYADVHELTTAVFENYMDIHMGTQRSMSITEPIENSPTGDEDKRKLAEKIRALQAIPQPTQKTTEWYEFRYNLITASNLWKVFGSAAQRNSLIYEKCKPLNLEQSTLGSSHTGSALHWGIKYEPLTVMIYEDMFHTRVGDFGCIRHPQHPCIGASPDGINIDPTSSRYGRMLEIKNIVNREITGVPKDEYWIQTQIQMETCDLDECDFVETRFKEYESDRAFYEDDTRKYKGVILNFISPGSQDGFAPVYKYMPLTVLLDPISINAWVSTTREEAKQDGLALFSVIYWYIDQFSCVLIPRNKEWFQAAFPKIDELWNTVLAERESGCEHRASKKRAPKPAPVQAMTVIRLSHDE